MIFVRRESSINVSDVESEDVGINVVGILFKVMFLMIVVVVDVMMNDEL